jgi:small subunit ribosomal protein S8
MMTDPIADMLTRIRNAARAGHAETLCPASKLKLAVARVLCDEGYLEEVASEEQEGRAVLRIRLRYGPDGQPLIEGIRRISRPSQRVFVGVAELPKIRNGLGVAVLSTPKGVISDRAARENSVGGELVCEVW